MRLPRKFSINGSIWEVKFKKKIAPKDAYGKETLGLCDSTEQIIYLKTGLPPQLRLSTLIHEILHMLDFEYKVNLDHPTVYKLESAIFDLLKENFL